MILSSSAVKMKKVQQNVISQQEIGRVYVELSKQTLKSLKLDLITKIFLIGLFGLLLSTINRLADWSKYYKADSRNRACGE